MGVETEWYGDDGRIVQVILKSPWAWIELERAFDRGLALISPVEHVVYFLIDFADQSRPPRGNSIMHLKRVIERSSAAPNFGKSILVNPNPFARSIIGMLLRFYGNSARIHLVNSREEALETIRHMVQAEAAPGQMTAD